MVSRFVRRCRTSGMSQLASFSYWIGTFCSDGSFASEDHGALTGQHAAVAVRKGDVAVLHLPLVALAAHLANRLDHDQQPVHARMAVGEAAAAGIYSELSAGRDGAVLDEAAGFALGTE